MFTAANKSLKDSQPILDHMIRYRTHHMILLALLTLVWIFPASRIHIDSTGVSFESAPLNALQQYQRFVQAFKPDDATLLAVSLDRPVSDFEPGTIEHRISRVRQTLLSLDGVRDVTTLGSSGIQELIKLLNRSSMNPAQTLLHARELIPGMSTLISKDLSTLGFIIHQNQNTLTGFEFEHRLSQMKQVVSNVFQRPCQAAGLPVLRAAFERYNLHSALTFGLLGLGFGMLTAFYIFKTFKAGLLVLISSIISLVWTLAVMALFGADINLATGMSFGFILVATTTTSFHLTSKYLHHAGPSPPLTAMRHTLEDVLQPGLMCALTTAASFLCLAVSPVPMVRQAGLIICLGVCLSFFSTLVIQIFFLPLLFSSGRGNPICAKRRDGLDLMVEKVFSFGFKFPLLSCIMAFVFLTGLIWGIPGIMSVKHLSSPMIKNTPEARDLEIVTRRLTGAYTFSLVLALDETRVNQRQFWYDMYRFEKQLASVNGIEHIDSLTPLVFQLAKTMTPAGMMPELVFQNMISRISKDALYLTYYAPQLSTYRMVVHINPESSDQIEQILTRTMQLASQSFDPPVSAFPAGRLLLLKSQTRDLVSSQLKSLFLACFAITLLMILNLRSMWLGLLSLIPNLFPLAAIFGIMGWFNIPLDPLTIFAAVISFGLSVDDSIHFLFRLRREIARSAGNESLDYCIFQAYRHTSRALISTTAVLFGAACGLMFSTFQHVSALGILIASASLVALVSDLVFLPAIVLTVRPLSGLLHKHLLLSIPETNEP